jgi:hypothetical protein
LEEEKKADNVIPQQEEKTCPDKIEDEVKRPEETSLPNIPESKHID